ncbi:solute carrier family 35 member F2-like [Clytia hemisphaerica]
MVLEDDEKTLLKHDALQTQDALQAREAVLDVKEKSALFSSIEQSTESNGNCCQNKMLLLKTIVSGQILSLMLSGTGTAATALSVKYKAETPSLNAFFMYVILASTFGVYAATRKEFKTIVRKHWWKYLIVAILDVEANYLLTKAYTYTTLTSVQLCDSFTIPTTMVISFIFLRIRYKVIHYIGVILCIGGAVCLIFTDGNDKSNNARNEILGDVIALTAAVLYGISNVGQEYLVKKYSAQMYLGIVGIVGFVITGLQTAIIERNDIASIDFKWQVGMLYFAFAICQYFYYTMMPVVMKLSSATVMNLSLLTSDLYTLLIGLLIFDYQFSNMYFVAFAGILTGLITYNVRPPPAAPPKRKKNTSMRIENGVDKPKNWTESSFKAQNGNTLFFYKNENGINNHNHIGNGNLNSTSSLVNNRTGPNRDYSGL